MTKVGYTDCLAMPREKAKRGSVRLVCEKGAIAGTARHSPVRNCILLKKYMLTAFCSEVLEYEPLATALVFFDSVSFCSRHVVS